jgi:hypothetical protein
MAMECLEHALRPSAVTKGLTHLLDAPLQRGLTDELARPGMLEQFLLGDDTVVMVQEVQENLKDLRSQVEDTLDAAECIEARVKLTVGKDVSHDFLCQALAGSHYDDWGTNPTGISRHHSIAAKYQEFLSKLPGQSQARYSQAMYRAGVPLVPHIQEKTPQRLESFHGTVRCRAGWRFHNGYR